MLPSSGVTSPLPMAARMSPNVSARSDERTLAQRLAEKGVTFMEVVQQLKAGTVLSRGGDEQSSLTHACRMDAMRASIGRLVQRTQEGRPRRLTICPWSAAEGAHSRSSSKLVLLRALAHIPSVRWRTILPVDRLNTGLPLGRAVHEGDPRNGGAHESAHVNRSSRTFELCAHGRKSSAGLP
jgi:hypothetical protein